MRQLAAASLMYVNDYKGFLPPLAVQGNTAGSLGRPCIFPQGSTSVDDPSFLTKYLGKDTLKLFVCPDREDEAGYNPNYNYSYRYNGTLGGFDSNRWIQFDLTTNRTFVPWKITQVHNATQIALFIEGMLVSGSSPTDNGMAFHRDSNAVSGGLNYQTIKQVDSPQYALHFRKNIGVYVNGNAWEGDDNIAYCDGSVRSVHVKLNSNPFSAWDGVFIDPYNPQAQW
jgi:hypothetical protein